MANYHVHVRDYHWCHQNTVVQSPVLRLDAPVPDLVVRPLEGPNNFEPRVLKSATELKDDICEDEYQVDAHGVFVSTNAQRTDYIPIWAPVHSSRCEAGEVYVVDLTTFRGLSVPIAQICWVPGLEAPDHRLYTVLGGSRRVLRAMKTLVLVQQLGLPKEAKLILVDPNELASYNKINDIRKRKLFEIQLRAIRAGSGPPSEVLQGGYRVFTSPDRIDDGRRSLDEIIDEDPGITWSSFSDSSSQDSVDSSDDDNSSRVRHNYGSMIGVLSRPYDCDCRYAALRPSAFNPRPSHRHKADKECSLGSNHSKHCVFADHNPAECVIPSSEGHQCCVDPVEADQFQKNERSEDEGYETTGTFDDLESDVRQLDMEERSSTTFCPDAEELYAANNSYVAFEYTDYEPDFIYSPSMGSQSHEALSIYSALTNVQCYSMTPYPQVDIAAGTIQESALNPFEYLETYGSPEPQDMVF